MARVSAALTMLLLAAGEGAPARVEARLPALLLGVGPHPIAVEALDAAGRPSPRAPFTFEALPADALTVDAAGQVTCLRSYDGVVTVTTSGAVATVVGAHCRLVFGVVSNRSVIDLTPGPRAPSAARFTAIDEAQRPLPDVPVVLVSSDPAVAVVEGAELRGVVPGEVEIDARAGAVRAMVSVRIVVRLRATVTLPPRRPDGSRWDRFGLPDPSIRVGSRTQTCWSQASCTVDFDATTGTGPIEVSVEEKDAPAEREPGSSSAYRTRLAPADPDHAASDPVGVGVCGVEVPCELGGATVWIERVGGGPPLGGAAHRRGGSRPP